MYYSHNHVILAYTAFSISFEFSICAVVITSAQSCHRITAGDLGDTNVSSSTGLIAERVGGSIRLQRFRVVCEVTAGTRDMYTGVSVVAEYNNASSTSMQAQFEFSCIIGNAWATVDLQGGFTSPPDTGNILFAIQRRDCYACVSPDTIGNSRPGTNHCLGTYQSRFR